MKFSVAHHSSQRRKRRNLLADFVTIWVDVLDPDGSSRIGRWIAGDVTAGRRSRSSGSSSGATSDI